MQKIRRDEMMKKALVVGGNSGIGLAAVLRLLSEGYEHIAIVGKGQMATDAIPPELMDAFEQHTTFFPLDLTAEDYSVFDTLQDVDTLIITAGFGRVALFENLTETEIKNLVKCNQLAVIQILKKYYHKLNADENFDCAVMVSIAGHVASPFFSVYGAAKAGLAMFIENINVELAAAGRKNRVLDVSPGSLKGTAFGGGKNDVALLDALAGDIITRARNKEMLFIPSYEEVYKGVMDRYHKDGMAFGLQSYEYKVQSGRISHRPQVVVGYLSGTFDLFHIGHLKLLQRAKEQCDYLIVGVHESGTWKKKETFIPFEERLAIVANIKYVDKAVKSYPEDCDAWDEFHYHKLFVGSDYKGSERFSKYEKYFAEKNVEIIYFPYTQGTSSTQLREALKKPRE